MGGSGSGRIGEKILTSQMIELDVRSLHGRGLIKKAALSPLSLQHQSKIFRHPDCRSRHLLCIADHHRTPALLQLPQYLIFQL